MTSNFNLLTRQKMASRLNLDEVVSRLFDDDFGLSEDESSEEEGDEDRSSIHAFTGPRTVDTEELAALGSFVTSQEVRQWRY